MHKCVKTSFWLLFPLNIFCLFWTIKCFLFLKFKLFFFFSCFYSVHKMFWYYTFFQLFSFKELSQVRKPALSLTPKMVLCQNLSSSLSLQLSIWGAHLCVFRSNNAQNCSFQHITHWLHRCAFWLLKASERSLKHSHVSQSSFLAALNY